MHSKQLIDYQKDIYMKSSVFFWYKPLAAAEDEPVRIGGGRQEEFRHPYFKQS